MDHKLAFSNTLITISMTYFTLNISEFNFQAESRVFFLTALTD
jgi:hypothetical protein